MTKRNNTLGQVVFTFLSLFFLVDAFAGNSDLEQTRTEVKTLQFGISMSIPPWVIKDNNTGIELDIIKLALDQERYQIKPNYVPFALAFKLFEAGNLDGVMNAKEGVSSKGYLSDPVVTFQNVAISLASKNFPEDINMSFLGDKFVAAFQKASQLLGPEFAMMAAENPGYQELAKQSLQINLLFIRNTDFIVMDKSIFGYYWNEAIANQKASMINYNYNKAIRFHYLFPPTDYPFLFADEQVRDDFNRGLRRIRANGEYQKILDKYDHLTKLYERQMSGSDY